MLSGFHESESFEERSSDYKKRKSVMKALKMSVVHVVMFGLSWTPYTIMATWLVNKGIQFHCIPCSRDTIDKASARQVPGSVQDILYLTAVLNSCLNPLIYGVYYYTEKR